MKTTTTTQIATTTAKIAAIYIEASRAAKEFVDTRNQDAKDRHRELFTEASEQFTALIALNMESYNGPLRDLREAVVNMEFGMAEARYSTIAK